MFAEMAPVPHDHMTKKLLKGIDSADKGLRVMVVVFVIM